MEPDALPAWAEEHAASWLADRGARWDHVRGVARQAQRVSLALDEDDRPYLVAAAWLHDIGYVPTLAATAFHPLDGARHLRALGHERLAGLVAYHSSARWEAEALGSERRPGRVLPRGLGNCGRAHLLRHDHQPDRPAVTLTEHLAEIGERYGAEHLVVRCLQRAHDHLAGAVQRTEERMRAGGVAE